MAEIELSTNVQDAYNEQYNNRMTLWREIGAKYKSKNIQKVTKSQSFKKVLEFGAGEGSILKFLDEIPQFEELYALEISDSGIDQIKNRGLKNLIEVKKFNGYETDYADNEFDLLYCSHVIEHVEHPRLVLREIRRISKNQVFEVPLDYGEYLDSKMDHFLGYGHINIFTPSLFKFLLKSEGFEIEEELHTGMEKEVLEFNWFNNQGLKKTIFRKLLAFYISKKPQLISLVYGKEKSNEFYNSAYTCFTKKSGTLKIF